MRGQQNALARRESGGSLIINLSHVAIVDRSVPATYIIDVDRVVYLS
jgi:hypothetical protein